MAQLRETQPDALPQQQSRGFGMAGTIIGSHSIQHMYFSGFLIILPSLYTSLALAPIQAGIMDAVRRITGGVASMGGGIMVDRLQNLRGIILGFSLLLMGLGYLFVGLVPAYIVVLFALGFASAAGSLWHPPALGILSQRWPTRRGLLLSLHRSSGTAGESLAPTLVGFLLLAVAWQVVLQGGFFLTVAAAILLWATLWRMTGAVPSTGVGQGRSFRDQFSALGQVIRQPGLIALLVLAGVRGMGDSALVFYLPLYLTTELGMGSVGSGVHLTLLTFLAIFFGPTWGWLSDRWGRKPVMVTIMIISTALASLMVLTGDGLSLTVLIILMGTVMFSINSLVQAAAMDLAEGKQLEGSLIGLLWGNNALFGSVSPIVLGGLAGHFGFWVIFPYAAAMHLIGTLAALALPKLRSRRAA